MAGEGSFAIIDRPLRESPALKTAARIPLALAACLGLTLAGPCIADDSARSVEAVKRQAPGARPAPLQDTSTMLDTITGKGERLLVVKGTRKAGTRAAVHIHPHAGHTCVISGSIALLIEGRQPHTVGAGRCFYMPANVAMAAANLGTEDAVLIDTFILQPGHAEMTLLEQYP